MTKDELIAFEADIAAEFNAGHIKAPIHLDGNNEDQLIRIFETIDRSDWVLGSWRMHYKCLLHGVPPVLLKAEIMAGRSIALCFPEYRIISSAIVAGTLPIAMGIAWWLKRERRPEHVHAFLGDMTALTGQFHECRFYAFQHELPIRWIVESNGKSVCTPTFDVWGMEGAGEDFASSRVEYFTYELPWPHSGAGVRVQF